MTVFYHELFENYEEFVFVCNFWASRIMGILDVQI